MQIDSFRSPLKNRSQLKGKGLDFSYFNRPILVITCPLIWNCSKKGKLSSNVVINETFASFRIIVQTKVCKGIKVEFGIHNSSILTKGTKSTVWSYKTRFQNLNVIVNNFSRKIIVKYDHIFYLNVILFCGFNIITQHFAD